MNVRRAYADTPMGQLHYAEAGSGPVLLMLHQTPRSHDEFAEVQPLLADGYRTIAMDMVGFGSSVRLTAPQSIEAMAAGVFALLDSLGIRTASILGHHTGAVVAQEVAVQAPERVAALVLCAMPWVDAQRRAAGHGVGVDQAETDEDGGHLVQLWRLRQPYYPAGRPDLLNRFMHDALARGLDPAEGHRSVDRYEMDVRIGAVTAPVLLLVPTSDPFAVAAVAHVTAALTGVAELEVRRIEGASIPAMEEYATEVAYQVRTFLERLT